MDCGRLCLLRLSLLWADKVTPASSLRVVREMEEKSSHNENSQTGSLGYGGLPREFTNYEQAKIVILPIPFDKTSTWSKGSDKGPEAIIEASRNMELYDIETRTEVFREGVWTAKPVILKTSRQMIREVYRLVESFLGQDKFVVTLGGEHTVCLGAINAHADFYDDLSVLQLDAHADLRGEYQGNPESHACVMARVAEKVDDIVSVGIRSMDSSELGLIREEKVFYAHRIASVDDWMDRVADQLSPNVYITIDVDVFDPGIMPSTGTPEPGGLDWYAVMHLLKRVTEKRRVVGFDVVELCPSQNKAPDFLAAKLVYKLLSYKFFANPF